MKKQILLFSSIIVSSVVMAQTQPTFGIRAGVSSSSIKGDAANSLQDLLEVTDGIVTTGSRTGVFAGVNASIPVSGNISFEPGIYYAQKGYEMKGSLDLKGIEFLGANAKAKLTSHYVDIPLVLKANMGGFEVFAGPQLSYLAKADLKTRPVYLVSIYSTKPWMPLSNSIVGMRELPGVSATSLQMA